MTVFKSSGLFLWWKPKIMEPTRRLVVTEVRRERASIVCFPFLSVHVVKVNAFCSTANCSFSRSSCCPRNSLESRECALKAEKWPRHCFLFFSFFYFGRSNISSRSGDPLCSPHSLRRFITRNLRRRDERQQEVSDFNELARGVAIITITRDLVRAQEEPAWTCRCAYYEDE